MELSSQAIGVLKKVRRFFIGIGRVLANLGKVYAYAYNPKLALSYYPDQPRKSKLKIYFENLWWLICHQEINEFYYVYGFDRAESIDTRGYMDYLSFRKLRDRANSGARMAFRHVDYRCLLSDKFAFSQYLTSLGFATPRIVALCDSGSITWLDKDKSEPWNSLLNGEKKDYFLKDLTGQCAEGVYHIEVDNGKILMNGQTATLDDLRGRIKGMWFIQQRLFQHQKMAKLHSSSVNCVRLVTTYTNGIATPFSALLRIGAHGACCDNWASGGILCGVELASGKVSKYGFFKPGYGGRVERHPETGVVFDGYEIPHFQKAVDTALRLHRFLYGIHSIGWDIAIGENGPVFIEGNDNWEISMHQLHDGGLKRQFLDTLSK
ncbi:MAG: sugar-transfer associated ATP-grasp domain-containing protein [Sedimentisphaerales bacterium]|nr:sugar-transfer associated ATP-grasp domain-containing protein [Sedimentisphaerales bacterium]